MISDNTMHSFNIRMKPFFTNFVSFFLVKMWIQNEIQDNLDLLLHTNFVSSLIRLSLRKVWGERQEDRCTWQRDVLDLLDRQQIICNSHIIVFLSSRALNKIWPYCILYLRIFTYFSGNQNYGRFLLFCVYLHVSLLYNILPKP